MAMPDLPERPQDRRRRKEYGTSRVRKWEKALNYALEQKFGSQELTRAGKPVKHRASTLKADEIYRWVSGGRRDWQDVADKYGVSEKGAKNILVTAEMRPRQGMDQIKRVLKSEAGKTESWQEGFSLALQATPEGCSIREVSVLRDPSQRILGTIRKLSDDTLEVRNSSNKFRGSYDPNANETRDSTGRLIGTGNLLAALLVNETKGVTRPPGLSKGKYWDYVGKTPFGTEPKSDKIPDQGKKKEPGKIEPKGDKQAARDAHAKKMASKRKELAALKAKTAATKKARKGIEGLGKDAAKLLKGMSPEKQKAVLQRALHGTSAKKMTSLKKTYARDKKAFGREVADKLAGMSPDQRTKTIKKAMGETHLQKGDKATGTVSKAAPDKADPGAEEYGIKGATKVEDRDYKKEYRDYHGTPKQRDNRNNRNKARRKMDLEDGDEREVDHSKPLSQGGTNHRNNLKVMSFAKNRAKGAKYEARKKTGTPFSTRAAAERQAKKLNSRQYKDAHYFPWDAEVYQDKDDGKWYILVSDDLAGPMGTWEESAEPIMEPGFVKTPADEKRWDRAKKLAKKSNPDNMYAVANHIFHNIKKHEAVAMKEATTPKEMGMNIQTWGRWQAIGPYNTSKTLRPIAGRKATEYWEIHHAGKSVGFVRKERADYRSYVWNDSAKRNFSLIGDSRLNLRSAVEALAATDVHLEARGSSPEFECQECLKKFRKKIPRSGEVTCPKCKSIDVYPLDFFSPTKPYKVRGQKENWIGEFAEALDGEPSPQWVESFAGVLDEIGHKQKSVIDKRQKLLKKAADLQDKLVDAEGAEWDRIHKELKKTEKEIERIQYGKIKRRESVDEGGAIGAPMFKHQIQRRKKVAGKKGTAPFKHQKPGDRPPGQGAAPFKHQREPKNEAYQPRPAYSAEEILQLQEAVLTEDFAVMVDGRAAAWFPAKATAERQAETLRKSNPGKTVTVKERPY